MAFYTSATQRGNKIYVRGYNLGLRFQDVVEYKPYMFVPKKGGKYKTLDGREVGKLDFDSIRDAKDFCEQYKDVANYEIFGLSNYLYAYINDTFTGDIEYDPTIVKVGVLDIETKSDAGFPSIERADQEITAITVKYKNKAFVFVCGEYVTKDSNIEYFKCKDEYELIQQFLNTWIALDLDIVTGWNIEFFDIPYLVNRITRLFNAKEAAKLSPWRILQEKTVEYKNKENQCFIPVGLAVLDYYQLYRKFMFGNQESYKLDYIAQVELGDKKVDYSEYGNLLELYKNNYQLFIDYNVHDCTLVERLDDKLKFIEQVMALAYDAKVNYNDTLTTVLAWDVIIHNHLLEQKIVIPQFKRQHIEHALVGGYVKEPKIGLSKWVTSIDLTSSYPNNIIQYNISPETFIRREDNFDIIDNIIKGIDKNRSVSSMLSQVLPDFSFSTAANGCLYSNEKQGFLPALMDKMLKDREKYKKLMLEAKKELELVNVELEKR